MTKKDDTSLLSQTLKNLDAIISSKKEKMKLKTIMLKFKQMVKQQN